MRKRVELHRRGERDVGAHLVLGVLVADHAVGPVEHLVAVLVGDPEEFGDHHEREFGRDVGHEVGFAGATDPVDDLVGRLVDGGLEVAHHSGVNPLFTSRR